VDASVVAFAGWTLCVHATRVAGGSLAVLVGGAAAAGASALVAARWLGSRAPEDGGVRPGAVAPAVDGSAAPGARVAIAPVALAVVATAAPGAPPWLFWSAALALCAVLAARELRRPVAAPPPGPFRRGHVVFLAAASALCVAVTLCARRPDADDAYFVNLAVAAADAPFAPLGARDTLHGLPGPPAGMPAGYPTYRLHAVELLAGALAWLGGVRAIAVAHLGVAAAAAALLPLALARAARELAGAAWPVAVGAALLVLLAFGDTHHGYGNLGPVRLHQGKAVFVSLVVPLLVAYGLGFARRPGARTWLRLAAVQVAGLGLSASALWAAPAVAGLALAAGVPATRAGARTLALGLGASAYPLLAAALLVGATREAVGAHDLARDTGALFEHARAVVLGSGPAAWLAWLGVLGGAALAPTRVARRVAIAFPLGFLALLWNPLLTPWLAEHVTGAPTYWRVFWVLPVPLLLGVAVAGASALAGRRGGRPGALAAAAACALALCIAPSDGTLSADNRVRLGAPGLDVPEPAFRAAEALARHAPPGAGVLAPYPVAAWVPTLRADLSPLAVRTDYLLGLRAVLGDDEVARRGLLVNLVSGPDPDPRALRVLRARLDDGSLAAVCVAAAAPPAVRVALEDAGLAEVAAAGGYRVYARAPR